MMVAKVSNGSKAVLHQTLILENPVLPLTTLSGHLEFVYMPLAVVS